MDNIQTGAFIRELRKEQGLTQKDLATQLHITDRAVSKWERGLCAPDLATLEPLSEILGITVAELIAGRHMAEISHKESIDENVHNTLQYSKEELRQKTRSFRKAYLAGIALFCTLLLAVSGFLWWKGVFNIVHRAESPDGTNLLTVYNRDIAIDRFSRDPRITVRTDFPPGEGWSTVIYPGTFQGAWWSPDSEKYVLAFQTEQGTQLTMSSLSAHNHRNLNAYLSMGVEQSELSKYAFQGLDDIFPKIDYQFLQWSLDSRSMLIYYSFTDSAQSSHEGYFWYHHITGTVTATLELQT